MGVLQIPSTDFVQKTSCKCRRKISRKGISMNATDRSRNEKVISSFVDPRQRAKAVNSRKRKRERMRSLNIGSPLKAIRQYCLDCTGNSTAAVKGCGNASCHLWPYRFGRSPIESDMQVPVYDDYGNLVGYRNYRTYPEEVGGAGKSE